MPMRHTRMTPAVALLLVAWQFPNPLGSWELESYGWLDGALLPSAFFSSAREALRMLRIA